jgi:hypothetical protein
MKKTMLIITLFLFCIINAQSTDRFIRIVGNSAYDFKADSYRVYYNISEILPNEYAKTDYKSLESNVSELNENLKKIGIKENQININYKNKNMSYGGGYGNAKINFYYVDINSKELLNNFFSIKSNGFKIENTKFLYKNSNENIEFNLAKNAIDDAKRKANSIAKEIKMNVGKILNIEDKSSGCCSNFGELDTDEINKKYTIHVTFQLID